MMHSKHSVKVHTDGVGVGVGDPGHLSLAGAHVGGRDINTGSKETLLGELDSEPPGDPLQLVLGVLLGVDLDAGLAATERDVDACALVSHQGGQSLDLVSADIKGITNSSLAGAPGDGRDVRRYIVS